MLINCLKLEVRNLALSVQNTNHHSYTSPFHIAQPRGPELVLGAVGDTWSKEIFAKEFSWLHQNGRLSTLYSQTFNPHPPATETGDSMVGGAGEHKDTFLTCPSIVLHRRKIHKGTVHTPKIQSRHGQSQHRPICAPMPSAIAR